MDNLPSQEKERSVVNDEWLEGLDEYIDSTYDGELAEVLDLPPVDTSTHTITAATTAALSDSSFYEDEDNEAPYIAPVYAPQVVAPWTAALAFDVALGLDTIETLLERHGITPQDWEHIAGNHLFNRQVAEQAREMGETGVSFRGKARVQAEMYLVDLDKMIASPGTDQKVKLEAIRSVVKWAGLEPRPDKEEANKMPQVNIQINM